MNKNLLISTAVGLMVGAGALAQSPNDSTKRSQPSAQTDQTEKNSSSSTQRAAPADSSTQNQPSNSAAGQSGTPSSNSPSQAQNTPPASGQKGSSGASQPQSTSPASEQGSGSQSQAQNPPPASGQQTGSSTPSQPQTSNPPPANNQAQQAPANAGAGNTTAQQPNQPSTAQSSSTNVNASVNINDQQRTRVTQSIARLNVQPLNNVNFSLSVGTVIPRDVRLQTLPADVVEVVPQYRDYSFFVVRDEIVIVEPSTYKIVAVLPRSGGSAAAAPAPSSKSKVALTDKDREIVRKHVRSTTTERRTTGSSGSARVEIRRGERVPDTVEFEEFPETIYREAPSLRDYRYIHRENRTYLVEPSERRVIEEID
jgi:uncharacterized protein DUF1236